MSGRRAQALGEQRQRSTPARARRRAGRHRGPLDADDVAEVEADQQLVGLLAEQVLAGVELDLAAAVAEVDEAGLAVPAPADDPARDAVAGVGLLPGASPSCAARTSAISSRPANPCGNGSTPASRIRSSFSRRSASTSESFGSSGCAQLARASLSRRLGRLDLGDLQFLLRPARDLDGDHVAALVADQRLADRRLVGELLLERVGLGRADDLEFLRVAGSSGP